MCKGTPHFSGGGNRDSDMLDPWLQITQTLKWQRWDSTQECLALQQGPWTPPSLFLRLVGEESTYLVSTGTSKLCSLLLLPLIEPLEGYAQGLLQARCAAPKSLFLQESFSLILPFPQESQGPSNSVQRSVDKLITQFKTDSFKINSAS